MYNRVVFLVLCFIVPAVSFAAATPTPTATPVGLGSVALNLMDPIMVFSDFIHNASLIIGGLFLFASIIKYREHRRNPIMVPISTVIFLVIAGTLLVCLPLLSLVTEGGIPYRIIR